MRTEQAYPMPAWAELMDHVSLTSRKCIVDHESSVNVWKRFPRFRSPSRLTDLARDTREWVMLEARNHDLQVQRWHDALPIEARSVSR